jgi:hypothetical protein
MGSLILLQVIRTVWTKASRGGALASRRNAVPDALPFLAALPPRHPQGILVHRVEFTEKAGFSLPASADSDSVEESSTRILGVLVERLGSNLHVTLDLDPARGVSGAPPRIAAIHGGAPPEFSLQTGEWGRVSYNSRYSPDEGWWYEKVVANTALLEKFDPRVFLRTDPSQELSDMAELW